MVVVAAAATVPTPASMVMVIAESRRWNGQAKDGDQTGNASELIHGIGVFALRRVTGPMSSTEICRI
jgi:hypothetical protein